MKRIHLPYGSVIFLSEVNTLQGFFDDLVKCLYTASTILFVYILNRSGDRNLVAIVEARPHSLHVGGALPW